MVTEHAPVPLQAPDQPVKVWPTLGDWLKVTTVPWV
jgi:hypothetical protein